MAQMTTSIPFPEITILNALSAAVKIQVDGTIRQARAVLVVDAQRLFELGRQIKKAIYGEVVMGHELVRIESEAGEIYQRAELTVAIKVYELRRLNDPNRVMAENPMNELAAMEYLKPHQHLMPLYCCCRDAAKMYSIMPYIQSEELFDYVDRVGPMNDEAAKIFMRQLVSGMIQMQTLGVAHRDMSLENTLVLAPNALEPCNRYMIIDFGMSLRLPPHPEIPNAYLPIQYPGKCGKRSYISPEVHRREPMINPIVSDVWGAGVLLFMCLTGIPPVDEAVDRDNRFRVIKGGQLAQLLATWHIELDPAVVDLMQRMLTASPMQRITVDQVATHPWLQM